MSSGTMEEMTRMTNCELTLLAFEAGTLIAAAQKNCLPVPDEARNIFVAAYRELLQRPTQSGMVESASARSQLSWSCSHAGFELTHPQFGKLGMIRDRRSPTGYRVMIPAVRAKASGV
jgi:hypothetical protein